MKLWKNILIGFASACVSAVLYLSGVFPVMEDRVYDFFLKFRANRVRINNVVFLDVDDEAIAYNGLYPWPRSIPAGGLLRLKEYGTLAAIFDIEYIDRGPQGVDDLYLNHGLGNDFNRSFGEIGSAAQDIFSALRAGRIDRSNIDTHARNYFSLINAEQKNLFSKARGIARDNDQYLAKAIALLGRSWLTLNLREYPLDGEQSERLPVARERFSYPVNAAGDANTGAGFVDILPALPVFSTVSKGAGFTNAEVDNDGTRRRIYLAQNIQNHWYLQLSFAPLVDYFGNPGIALEKNTLTIKQAKLPDGAKKDYVIPLDEKGRMMLDWPKEDYPGSYKPHISFGDFSLLDEIEAEIEEYSRLLASADIMFFAQFDTSLSVIPIILGDAGELLDAAHTMRNNALENISDDSFNAFLKYRNTGYSVLAELAAFKEKIENLSVLLSGEFPESAGMIQDEAGHITQLIDFIEIDLNRRNELTEFHDKAIRDKFCIIGRVDTGTTDYGANPFHGKYVNVGTHAVVLDTILSESFIVPVKLWMCIVITLVFVPLIFLLTSGLVPVIRALVCFFITAVFFVITILLFRFTGFYFGPLGITFAMIGALIIREIISYAGSEKEKQFIRTAFSTYVSNDVVKEIIADPSRLQLAGTKRFMTAVFTDVQGFSSISEKLDPEDLVSLLNRYLSVMSNVILDEKGTIDKYEGDAVIAFFGAPLDLSDHALRACISAIEIKKIESEMNKLIIEQKLSPSPLITRIGINTGYMVTGNMGTENKMNYTIMGDAVNLATRLKGVNKQYGTYILTSHDTVREAGDTLLYRKLDRVRVAGINEPVRLCELLNTAENAGEQDKKLVFVFHQALDQFERQNWKQAAAGFREALVVKAKDRPAKMYYDRSIQFIDNPPFENWDGVYNLTSK
ncbi:MAG: CHASE2 domain-containing protein [Treponema sp.]|jgi:adenylate cyclase|nr:CHASE2 domain-containing protein [Treponema sp.]